MGACVASRLGQEEEVVSICRERKQQLKLAVERRYTLADAHYRYCQSLNGVSAAINLFVTCHSTASSPFMITFPPPNPCPHQSPPPNDNVVSNPLFLQQTPSEPTKQTISSQTYQPASSTQPTHSSSSSSSSSEEEEEEEGAEEEMQKHNQAGCGYYYMEPHTSQQNFGWDFFNPFPDVKPEMISQHNRLTEEDLRILREQEGIPELEEDEDKWEEAKTEKFTQGNNNVEQENKVEVINSVETETTPKDSRSQVEHKNLSVIDNPVQGRELLEALRDIEDYFKRAYDSGKDVSRMLEVNRVQLQSNLEEIKESSTKIIQAITWRSSLSRSSSSKSLVASSSKSSSTWTEFKNDLFDDYGGMDSGSHSLTLGRIYAWEKKLYEEVKAGDDTRKIYERKCNVLRNQDVKGDEGITVDKTRAAVKDLYSRILVAIRRAETISKRIEKIRDEELQPQVNELLLGMMRCWKIMMESHEIQNKIMFDVKCFTCPTYMKFCNGSHRLATRQLEVELLNWRMCFTGYVAAQKAYVEAMHGWLAKFIVPEVQFYSRSRSSAPPCVVNGPQLLITCRDWLSCMQKLPKREVSYAIKCCAKDVKALWIQQGEEQKQKRKVDGLRKELEKKALAVHKSESSMYELRLTEYKTDEETDHHQSESLIERKDCLNDLKRKVELEKEDHKNSMLETQRLTLNGFQTGFCRVFESMKEFSMASYKMYDDLLSKDVNADAEKESSTSTSSHCESFLPPHQVGNSP